MFLRATTRKKDGKTHRYWSVVENRRLADGRVLQRHVLYLGEINDSQAGAWRRSIEVLDEREDAPRTVALFPEDRILAKKLGNGIWEIRSNLPRGRIARVLFMVKDRQMVLLHGFVKRDRKTRTEDLSLARKRKRQFERA